MCRLSRIDRAINETDLSKFGPQSQHVQDLQPDDIGHFIDPDRLFLEPDSLTFIYTNEGKMYYGNSNITHYGLIVRNPELVDRYDLRKFFEFQKIQIGESLWKDAAEDIEFADNDLNFGSGVDLKSNVVGRSSGSDEEESWDAWDDADYGKWSGSVPEPREVAMEMGDLAGRLGKIPNLYRNKKVYSFDNFVVSFWNENLETLNALLSPCIQQLIEDGNIGPDDYISTIFHNIVKITDLKKVAASETLDADKLAQMELYKKLHLMRGKEKQAAMAQLGVGGGHQPHPMAANMVKSGMLAPGQKWWAPHSESFVRRLNEILS